MSMGHGARSSAECGTGDVGPTIPPISSYASMMTLSKGDKVHWNTSQGETTGTTVEKKTKDFTLDGQKFKPTDDDPYWIVESAKSGKQAAHKESALRKA